MSTISWILTGFAVFYFLRVVYQKQRMAFLAGHLKQFQIEKNMQTLHEGYMRALREDGEARRQQIWELHAPAERALARQLRQLSDALAKEPQARTRISKLAICIPFLDQVLPASTRDFRDLLHIHAAGFEQVEGNASGLDAQQRAYRLSAEMLLLQHSCHWFCKSLNVANARLFARHQVTHAKVLESVAPNTRRAYTEWLRS